MKDWKAKASEAFQCSLEAMWKARCEVAELRLPKLKWAGRVVVKTRLDRGRSRDSWSFDRHRQYVGR